MNKIELSIILTTYNLEKYIEQTLDSILSNLEQNVASKIEIVICDDLSTDSTLLLIESICQKYNFNNLKLFVNEKNYRFPGHGLNTCIENATGKYLHIVDGDDLVNNSIYKSIVGQEFPSDILVFSHVLFDTNTNKIFKSEPVTSRCFDQYPYNKTIELYGNEIKSYCYWDKIYKLDFIKNNNIKFVEDRSAQDMNFNCKVFALKPSIEYFPQILLYYRCGVDSISTRLNSKKVSDNITSIKDKLAIFPSNTEQLYSYLIKLLLHTNSSEIEQNMQIMHENNIFTKKEEVDYKSYDSFLFNTLINAYVDKDINKISKLIHLKSFQKELVSCFDRKLENIYTSRFLKVILLFNAFDEMNVSVDFIKDIVVDIDLPKIYKIHGSEIFLEALNITLNLLEKYNLVEYFINVKKLKLVVNNIEDLKNYYLSNIKERKYKYSLVLLNTDDKKSITKFIESFINTGYKNAELIIASNYSLKKIKNDNITFIKVPKNSNIDYVQHAMLNVSGNYISFPNANDVLKSNYFEVADKYLLDFTTDILRFNCSVIKNTGTLAHKTYKNMVNSQGKFDNSGKHNVSLLKEFGESILHHNLVFINHRIINSEKVVLNYITNSAYLNECLLSANTIHLITEVIYYCSDSNDLKTSYLIDDTKLDNLFYSYLELILALEKLNGSDDRYRFYFSTQFNVTVEQLIEKSYFEKLSSKIILYYSILEQITLANFSNLLATKGINNGKEINRICTNYKGN